MRSKFIILMTILLCACTTTPKPPDVAQITFISMERATVQEWEIMGDYHANAFDVPGYKIRFESDRVIAPAQGLAENGFLALEYYECNASDRHEPGTTYSARDYVRFTWSQSDIVQRNTNGSIVYETQLIGDIVQRKKPPICAQVFVNDGRINRKVWQPSIISNPIELIFPE